MTFNTKNRHLARQICARMARDRKAGRWHTTHEGIAFTHHAVLADGQKRLMSIIESGVSAWMLVTWGLTEQARQAIDRGQGRSTADALMMSGVEWITPRVVSAARRMHGGPTVSPGSSTYLTDGEVEAFCEKHKAALEFACGCLIQKKFTQAAVTAVFARAFYHIDSDRLKVAGEVLQSGMGDSIGSLIRLRDLIRDSSGGGATSGGVLYRKAQVALLAWSEGRSLSQLRETTEDLFPLPGDENGQTGAA